MAMSWDYPNIATLRIDNATDADGYLVVNSETQVPTNNKALSFKGFKTPDDNEDANGENSAYRLFTSIVLGGIFGLEEGLNLQSGVAQVNAKIVGDIE